MQLLCESANWTFDDLMRIAEAERKIAEEELGLDYYPFQIEIITAEQMMDMYTASLPIMYNHWSFGKHFLLHERNYRRRGGLAYEIVINTNPCRAYCMETNTAIMQALVIAHAAFGHNAFFKCNHAFRQWTHADAIVDYLAFARNYIAGCEEQFGIDAVEAVLDACHALQIYGVDRYSHAPDLSLEEEEKRQKERAQQMERDLDVLWRTIPKKETSNGNAEEREKRFPKEPQENILYFLEKNAPNLPIWKREIIRIVRKIAQYFYPQSLTKFMNEGFATFIHYYIMNRLYEKGLLAEGAMIEFLRNHTDVAHQPDMMPVINPYDVCFKILQDVRRICETPTAEDREWFPHIAGSDWKEVIMDAMMNYKDESFVLQFLSPKVIRDFRMFSILDDDQDQAMEVTAVQRDDGYRYIRRVLASQYDTCVWQPSIEVQNVDGKGDRTLILRYRRNNRRLLVEEEVSEVLLHVYSLWEFPVELEVEREDGSIQRPWRVESGTVVRSPSKQ